MTKNRSLLQKQTKKQGLENVKHISSHEGGRSDVVYWKDTVLMDMTQSLKKIICDYQTTAPKVAVTLLVNAQMLHVFCTGISHAALFGVLTGGSAPVSPAVAAEGNNLVKYSVKSSSKGNLDHGRPTMNLELLGKQQKCLYFQFR